MAYPHVSITPGRNGEYHYVKVPGGRSIRLRERPGTAAYAAEHARALVERERRMLAGQPVPRSSTFAALCALYRQSDVFEAQGPVTQRNSRFNIARLEKLFGHRLHESIGYGDLQTMMHDLRDRPSMANILLKAFRAVWLAGIDAGAVSPKTALPWTGIRLRKRPKPRRPTWDDGHMVKFAERWPLGTVPHLVATLGYQTLQRGGDLVRMAWDMIEGDAIVMAQNKTGARVAVPISRALDAALHGGAAGRSTFIVNAKRRSYRCRADLGRDFVKWCAAAGIEGMTLHALRRGGATRLINLGTPLDEVAAMGGWASISQMEAYIGGRDRSAAARRAVARLDAADFQSPSKERPIPETGEAAKTFIAQLFRDVLNGSQIIAQRKSALSCEAAIPHHVHRTMTREMARL